MSEQQSSRRGFLKLLGLTAGATLASKNVFAAFIDKTEIRKLNPKQQEFMLRYGKWMDEFIEMIRVQKTDPDNITNLKKMVELSEKAEALQPELSEFMKDETFALIYHASIDRVSREIEIRDHSS
jgi:hypothetical protein